VNISSTLARGGDVFTQAFPSTPSTCETEQLIFAENYSAQVSWNKRYWYTVSNDSGEVIYDRMPGYLFGGERWDGNLNVSGNITGNYLFTIPGAYANATDSNLPWWNNGTQLFKIGVT
jgi:hypothetical protein